MTPPWAIFVSSVPSSNYLISVLDPWRAFLSRNGALQGPSIRLIRYLRNYREIQETRAPSGVAALGWRLQDTDMNN